MSDLAHDQAKTGDPFRHSSRDTPRAGNDAHNREHVCHATLLGHCPVCGAKVQDAHQHGLGQIGVPQGKVNADVPQAPTEPSREELEQQLRDAEKALADAEAKVAS